MTALDINEINQVREAYALIRSDHSDFFLESIPIPSTCKKYAHIHIAIWNKIFISAVEIKEDYRMLLLYHSLRIKNKTNHVQ